MSLGFARYIIGDAGNVDRLHMAVRAASMAPTDDPMQQREVFIEQFGKISGTGPRKRGLTKQRSAEPHLAFARELRLLDKEEGWRITPLGNAFLVLWDRYPGKPPAFFLTGLLLKFDRSFLIPFLQARSDGEDDDAAAGKAWSELWRRFGDTLASVEPPLPAELAPRTRHHHAAARIRFLESDEGLKLLPGQVYRLAEAFATHAYSPLPSNSYRLIARAITGKDPAPMNPAQASAKIREVYELLQPRHAYASATAAYHTINEVALPAASLDLDVFNRALRSDSGFTLQSDFQPGELLYAVRSKA
jgi:hypothetical protein